MPIAIPFQAAQAAPFIAQLHQKKPLVHCLTNDVVQNFTANVLLAIGATPAMVVAKEEVENFVTVADSLLINIGTVHASLAETMLLTARKADLTKTPWVLDPVAVGLPLTYRTLLAEQLLTYRPIAIRGNAAEILALAGESSHSRGPDSQDSPEAALNAARRLASLLQTIVAVTGKIDYITDGEMTYQVDGGHFSLTRITGTGCSLSAIIAALVSVSSDTLSAVACGCLMMKYAGYHANSSQGLGSFAVSLLDQLSLINEYNIREYH